jgi:hypothetical protein
MPLCRTKDDTPIIEKIYIICTLCWFFFNNYAIMHGVERKKDLHIIDNATMPLVF